MLSTLTAVSLAPGVADISTPGVPDIITPVEAAALFKVHRRQLQRWGVPCRVIGHKTTRYSRQEIYNWLVSRPTTRLKRKQERKVKKSSKSSR